MRILFSASSYPTNKYPFASFIGAMAEEFARRGHDVTVVAPQSITHSLLRNSPILPFYECISKEGFQFPIKVFRPKVVTFGDGKFRGRLTLKSYQNRVSDFFNKQHRVFDAVYCHFWQSAFQVLPYVEKNKLPLVVTSGEDKIKIVEFLKKEEIDLLRYLTTQAIAVSSKNKNESINCGLVNEKNIRVIPNGPDLRKFYPLERNNCRAKLGICENDFIVAFVGRFIHRKGAIRVEQAILSLNNPSIKAIFIGSTMKDEDKRQEPQGDEIIFKGIVPHDDVPMYLSAADVYVLPTLAEGCSNSIVEAMACGLPIVSSNLPFNFDIIDSDNAILVDPIDLDRISEAIKRLKDDPELRNRLSNNSLSKSQELSFEKRVDRIEEILKNTRINEQ